ncbi:hypothetical protein OS493_018350 [Desmophyllum pertusum]|uniref:Uncharacterized protein n=1 Tax=Desmophyllum pertusum TaxID=174260 RepID=A0A9X0CEV2_9CNID|nr:hypothetical protein OS493_018350 [Desmophyllum pertusum]
MSFIKREPLKKTQHFRTIRNRFTKRDQARSPQMGDSTGQHGGGLLEGSYNEEESAQSFAQALMAWRNSGKEEEKLWTNPTDPKSSFS